MGHLSFRSEQLQGFAVKYSPYHQNQLAYVANDNFGIQGRGNLYILAVLESTIHSLRNYTSPEILFDTTWCELDPDLCLTAVGDGSVQLWNIHIPTDPILVFKEHTKEAYSIQWSMLSGDNRFASASWDGTVKVWCLESPNSLCTFSCHQDMVYCVSWSTQIPGCIASVSGDKCLKIWNTRSPNVGVCSIPHDSEVLSCDWSKYDQNIIATGSADSVGRIWDLRFPPIPVAELCGHQYAIKSIKFSPHRNNILATTSYDFSTRIWNYQDSPNAIQVLQEHTEFVYGLDFNLHNEGEFADCSFDQTVCVYKPGHTHPQQ